VWPLITILMSGESLAAIPPIAPLKSLQPFGSRPADCSPPSWISRTIAGTPCCFNAAA
jgi:hypothetical protein